MMSCTTCKQCSNPIILKVENYQLVTRLVYLDLETMRVETEHGLSAESNDYSELREAFRVIDENHDGTLSYSELSKLIRLVSPDYSDSEIKLLMHKSDVNGDGKISFDEFVRLMSFGATDDVSTTEEAFRVFDSDKDGFITKLELSQVMQRIGHKYTGTLQIIRRILNTANIRVGFQSGNTLRSVLVQLKDRLPANRTRDCVYKIKCNDCIKVYIGQTARELHTRVGEHRRKINRSPRNAGEDRALLKDSAIAEHALDTGNKIDLENVEVLRRGLRSTTLRLMAEAVEIAKHFSVNRIEGVELGGVWRTVLHQSS
ncbi:calmodulin [Clonorchis sinensis]|uniref:Calmodulin n=1 Tax=Clonorchis sinensis TaxID=79923 RepID=G7YGU0_CLOSI|nr:calmodulin [Clonorchis sinensis]